MPIRQSDLDLAARLADAAGDAIRPYFRGELGTEMKDDHSPVTLADRAAEAAMRRILDAEAPGDAVHGEEYGSKDGVTGRRWVLDPIDGTRSFTVGRAIFGTLIALVEDGDIIRIDAEVGTIDLLVDEGVLAARKAAWQPRVSDYGSGALWRYAQNVGPAYKGAVTHPGAAAERHVYADI